MNLVLHRAQVALNINEFDITDQVTQQMNKVMPSITMPPDGVSPVAAAPAPALPGRAATPTQASAPPTTPAPGARFSDVAPCGRRAVLQRTGPHPLASWRGRRVGRSSGRELMLTGVAPLQTAGPQHVSFLDNRQYLPLLADTRAGAVIVHPDLASRRAAGAVAIVTREPYLGWARVAALFHPPPPAWPGIHPSPWSIRARVDRPRRRSGRSR